MTYEKYMKETFEDSNVKEFAITQILGFHFWHVCLNPHGSLMNRKPSEKKWMHC